MVKAVREAVNIN